MTDLRQAAKAVVDRWDTPAWEWRDQGPTADLMADLRKALAQPEQEPIGWLDGDETLAEFMHKDLKAAHDRCGSATPREFTIPVYLAPPAAQRKPLTATTILNLMPSSIPAEYDGALMEFARGVEALHNIKEGT
jgi:hypothetical protein